MERGWLLGLLLCNWQVGLQCCLSLGCLLGLLLG